MSLTRGASLLESLEDDKRTSKYEDFLTFLGIAQHLNIDMIPITWLPAMDVIGRGATAEIRENIATLQIRLAFKRLNLERLSEGERSIKPLIAEMSILGQPSIREHPNILTLEGVCWDVAKGGDVWPVLVFQKSEHGDLAKFMVRAPGKDLCAEDRLRLCADIAAAVMTMHSNGKVTQ